MMSLRTFCRAMWRQVSSSWPRTWWRRASRFSKWSPTSLAKSSSEIGEVALADSRAVTAKWARAPASSSSGRSWRYWNRTRRSAPASMPMRASSNSGLGALSSPMMK